MIKEMTNRPITKKSKKSLEESTRRTLQLLYLHAKNQNQQQYTRIPVEFTDSTTQIKTTKTFEIVVTPYLPTPSRRGSLLEAQQSTVTQNNNHNNQLPALNNNQDLNSIPTTGRQTTTSHESALSPHQYSSRHHLSTPNPSTGVLKANQQSFDVSEATVSHQNSSDGLSSPSITPFAP